MTTKHGMSNFVRGDTVYNIHGQQGAYITSYGGSHLVAPEYESVTHETCWGSPEEWREIFAEPPAIKLEAKMGELDKRITEKQAELKRVNKELDDSVRKHQEQLKKLKQHQALSRIEDYLDGKFTHFLQASDYYAPEIVTAEDALKNGGTEHENRWGKKLKLLTLFGDTKGDLLWRINRYSDGSGSGSTEVYPCGSEQEAIEIVRRLFADAVSEWREQENKHYGRAVNWADKCPDGWIQVPDDLAEFLSAMKLETRRSAIETAHKALAEAEAKLAALIANAESAT